MFRSISSIFRSRSKPAARRPKSQMEGLEQRTLFSLPHVVSVIADNRGEVFVNLDAASGGAIDPATITKSSALLYTAGTDGKLGTGDDVRLRESVGWNSSASRIILRAKIKPGTGYRVRLIASRIKTKTSEVLDGEFTGAFPSGNGVAGGDFNCQTKNDKTGATVRMSTTRGTVLIKLNATAAPKTVNWFLDRMNNGKYDNLIFNRSVSGSLVGAGSLFVNANNGLEESLIGPGLTPESTGLANTRGTIAMDRIPIDPTKSGNGFVFNTANNTKSSSLSVFGTVTSGLSVIDVINGLATIDLSQTHPFVLTDVKKFPVNDLGTAQSGFSPTRDGVIARRTAIQMKIGAI